MSDFLSRLKEENQIIIYPAQSDGEFLEEFTRMLAVAHMQRDFLDGKLKADTFLDFLDQEDFDIYALSEDSYNPC